MNDIFYYIGFIYIAYMLQAIYISFKPVKPENIIDLEGKTLSEYSEMKDKLIAKENVLESYLKQIVSAIFFIWLIIGSRSNAPEKHLFLFYAIFIFVVSFVIIGAILWTMMDSIFKNNAIVYNVEKKKPKYKINLALIKNGVGLAIISYILAHHFLM